MNTYDFDPTDNPATPDEHEAAELLGAPRDIDTVED